MPRRGFLLRSVSASQHVACVATSDYLWELLRRRLCSGGASLARRCGLQEDLLRNTRAVQFDRDPTSHAHAITAGGGYCLSLSVCLWHSEFVVNPFCILSDSDGGDGARVFRRILRLGGGAEASSGLLYNRRLLKAQSGAYNLPRAVGDELAKGSRSSRVDLHNAGSDDDRDGDGFLFRTTPTVFDKCVCF